jgi:hypothetical protein
MLAGAAGPAAGMQSKRRSSATSTHDVEHSRFLGSSPRRTTTFKPNLVTLPDSAPRITGLALENFRGFRESGRVALAPLTFLVGPNSSGKSSLASAMLLLAQSRLAPLGTLLPRWTGSLVDLGSYKDTVFAHETRRRIAISLDLQLSAEDIGTPTHLRSGLWPFHIRYEFQSVRTQPIGALAEVTVIDQTSRASVMVRRVRSDRIDVIMKFGATEESETVTSTDIEEGLHGTWSRAVRSLLRARLPRNPRKADRSPQEDAIGRLQSIFSLRALERLLQYVERVSSGRGGPQRWYSSGAIARDAARASSRGTLFDTVDPTTISSGDPGRSTGSRKRKSRVDREMASQLGALGIASAIRSHSISPYHATIEVKDSVTGVKSNLMEVGYGASQVLPVIRACLSSSPAPLFIEQPEIHLHPKAQGDIAELICDTSARRQVIVETHSPHMINRARIRVAAGLLPPTDVMIVFVSRGKQGSMVHHIGIDARGDFTAEWPGGFFDERYDETLLLLDAQARQDEGD